MFSGGRNLIQAPMAGVHGWELAASVYKAGGIGSIPCALFSIDQIREECKQYLKATNQNRLNVNLNFFTHSQFPKESNEEWKRELLKYYKEYQLTDDDLRGPFPSRNPFGESEMKLVEELNPSIVSFHFGLPSKNYMERLKKLDCFIISSATTLEEAIWLERNGATHIIAQGYEAGGHRGLFLQKNTNDVSTQIGLFALLPQIVDLVKVPVIAAGGICDKRTVQAAKLLGASAVQVGTTYLLCNEAKTSKVHRQALKQENSQTVLTNIFTGRPARSIVNKIIKEIGPISENAPKFPYATEGITPLKLKAEKNNLPHFSSLWSGQNNSKCKEQSAEIITRELLHAWNNLSSNL